MNERSSRRCASALVMFCVLAAGAPSWAQPSEVAAGEIRALELGLRGEAVARIVDALGRRFEATGHPEKAELVRAKRAPGEAFLREHLGSSYEVLSAELFRNEIAEGRLTAEEVKPGRELLRGLKGSFAVRALDAARLPVASSGYEPPRATGYPAEVAAIDNRAAHSMHDLPDYLSNRFTTTALDRAVTEGRTVEIHLGGETEALSDLRNRGFEVFGEVKSANGNYERLLLAEGPGGEIRYVVSGTLDGMDRARHLSSLLRFAGPEGRGLPSEKVVIVGDPAVVAESNYRLMREGLARIGLEGSTALIGFRASLGHELTRRATARRGAEHLRDVLGADPYEGLKERLAAERDAASGAEREKLSRVLEKVETSSALRDGLRHAPERVFSSSAELNELLAAEKALRDLAGSAKSQTLGSLLADGRLRVPGGGSAAELVSIRPVEFGPLRVDEVRVKTANGVESLKLVNNYYGDAMSNVVRALLDTGHSRLAYFGTAGGTAADAKVGDIHVPERVYDFRGELASEGVRNGFLEHFAGRSSSLGERLKTGTRLDNVFSPAVETMEWLERTRAAGTHAIEVENSYIAREIARHNAAGGRASFHTAVIISDVPGSDQTLGNNSGATKATFEKMVDHYLEVLRVQDLELVERKENRPPSRPLARGEHATRVAELVDRLVPGTVSPTKGTFLRDRIASLLQPLDLATLKSVAGSGSLRPSEIPGLSAEARAAIEGELAKPYTDAAAVESLEKGNAILSRLAAELRARFPTAGYGLKVGGGIERGLYSPNAGLTLEVTGEPALREALPELLNKARAGIAGAPPVTLGAVAEGALELGKGEVFRTQPRPLLEELTARAMRDRGARLHLRDKRVDYAGRQHDPRADPANLFSRYESYDVGPRASAAELRKFERLAARHGARVEYVPASDPRLSGGQGRTLLDAGGRAVVLLPNDRPVRRYALLDELTHVNQIDRLRAEIGGERLRALFRAAEAGEPPAVAEMLRWEIKAKRMVRMTLPAEHPDRVMLEREITRLERVLDPYREARLPSGRLNWEKVRATARHHAEGSASFLLGLFLKDLARVIHSGDREIIDAFFAGLATTDFWSHYGLFVVGAEAGTYAYTRFLQRFVKPSFVNTVLKSNVALATGMALPEIVRGTFDGKVFAINLSGLMLASGAVKAGLAGLRWVVPLGELARYQRMNRFLQLARGVPGWIYAGVELAVVLYFGEEISSRIGRWVEKHELRSEVGQAAGDLLAAAAEAEDPAELDEALDAAGLAYAQWRDRALRPAMDATARLSERLARAGREATFTGRGAEWLEENAARYPSLLASLERIRRQNEAAVDGMIDDAVSRFERERTDALRAAYHDNQRGSAYDPGDDPRAVSENRPESYADEARLYEAAADRASSDAVAARLREWAALTREIAARERAILDPELAPAGGAGASDVLEEVFGR